MGAEVDREFVKDHPLFRRLQESRLAALTGAIRVRRHQPGHMIQVEQDPVLRLSLIRQGRVKVSRFQRDGKEIILALRQDGEVFGEVELLEQTEAAASVTALSQTVLYTLAHKTVLELLRDPGFAGAMRRLLCRRCREAYSQAEVLAVNNADARVRVALHRLAKARGPAGLTRDDLGGLTGVSRETVSRVVSELQQRRLLKAERQSVQVDDPDRLLDQLLEG